MGAPAARVRAALVDREALAAWVPPGGMTGRFERVSGGRIRHTLTQFDGVAAVAEPTTVTSAIITGVGRGKSYGCGLLSIAPAGGAM
jgi:hypothetical protein